jgi:2,3-bisphosphoglycerate-independent phosphoglycerate mutase
MIRPKPVVLVTMSGVGVSPMIDGNALKQARMPTWKHLLETYPTSLLSASGVDVGLPSSSGGSPEAGHRTIGLGRPWKISEARVEKGLSDVEIHSVSTVRKQFRRLEKQGGTLHLIGLLSSDTSYANQQYVETLARYARESGILHIRFHLILDGVNAPPTAGLHLVRAFEARMKESQCGEIASVCGRAWGMDHDGFWDRTERAFQAMVFGVSDHKAQTAEQAIQQSYDEGIWDDQLPPTVIASQTKHHLMANGDAVLFWNTRPYGIRQLLKAFALPTIQAFNRSELPDIACLSLVEYDYDLPVEVLFPAEQPRMSLGCVLSRAGLRQLRIAEAERFAHVTVFLNGMHDASWPGEDRSIIPSPAVSSYEHVPEMAMEDVTDQTIKAIASGIYDVIVCNLCAPDIASSTGREDVAIKACEALDRMLHRLVEGTLAVGGVLIAVGDSGHVEALRDPLTNEVNKNATSNPVPCVIAGSAYEGLKATAGDIVAGDLALSKSSGTLSDIAPTILSILSLPIPKEMIGKPLI